MGSEGGFRDEAVRLVSPYESLIEEYDRVIESVKSGEKEDVKERAYMLLEGGGVFLEKELQEQISSLDANVAKEFLRRSGVIGRILGRKKREKKKHGLMVRASVLKGNLESIKGQRELLIAALRESFTKENSPNGHTIRLYKLEKQFLVVIQSLLSENIAYVMENGVRANTIPSLIQCVELLKNDCPGIMNIHPEFFLRAEIFKGSISSETDGQIPKIMAEFHQYCAWLITLLDFNAEHVKSVMLEEYLHPPEKK